MSDICEDCGDRWYDNSNLLYDEDGEWEDEDDAEDYV